MHSPRWTYLPSWTSHEASCSDPPHAGCQLVATPNGRMVTRVENTHPLSKVQLVCQLSSCCVPSMDPWYGAVYTVLRNICMYAVPVIRRSASQFAYGVVTGGRHLVMSRRGDSIFGTADLFTHSIPIQHSAFTRPRSRSPRGAVPNVKIHKRGRRLHFWPRHGTRHTTVSSMRT